MQTVNLPSLDTLTTGVFTLTYVATDSAGNQGTAERTVRVVDTSAPVIGAVTLSKTVLSPANKRLIPIVVNYTATDTCGGISSWLTATSSDPDGGTSGGDVTNDIQIVDEHHLSLRAEKVGGKTRTYTITIHSSDGKNESTKSVTVIVK